MTLSHVSRASFVIATLIHGAFGQTFTRVVDQTTPVPDAGGATFQYFTEAPTLSNGRVSFIGAYDQVHGVYTLSGGALQTIVDSNDPYPGTGGQIDSIIFLEADGDEIAFKGADFNGTLTRFGLFATSDGALKKLIENHSAIPGGVGTFASLSPNRVTFGEGCLVFGGSGSNGQVGLYQIATGTGVASVVADGNTTVPGKGETFRLFGEASLRDGAIVFIGGDQSLDRGVYETGVPGSPSTLSMIADDSTISPTDGGPLSVVVSPRVAHGEVVFVGGSFLNLGLVGTKGGLHAIADNATTVPEQTFSFTDFDEHAVDDDKVVFKGRAAPFGEKGPQFRGVYTTACGAVQKVLAEGDLLDGQTVRDVLIGPDSLEDDHLAMTVLFDDGSMAIYVVDLTTFEEFDQGEAGGDGVVPDLFGLGCLAPGATVTLETRDGPPGAAAIMVVGTTLGQSTVGGGTLLVIPTLALPYALDADGDQTCVLTVPNEPSVVGFRAFMQAIVADPSSPSGASLSRGLEATIGA